MSDTENQMGLFEGAAAPPPSQAQATQAQQSPSQQQKKPSAPPVRQAPPRVAPVKKSAVFERKTASRANAPRKGVSGLVPEGDVRLTANIRQDLHLKLKIASAYRRTTIGEIIEELVEKYL